MYGGDGVWGVGGGGGGGGGACTFGVYTSQNIHSTSQNINFKERPMLLADALPPLSLPINSCR